jgi:hypothetical protein
VDIWSNEVAQNNLRNAIDDFFFDVLRDERGVDLPVEVLDDLELNRLAGLLLDDDCAWLHSATADDIANLQFHQIAAT